MTKGRVTIIDVAREAGVDNSTVSLALRNDPRIRASTQQRVREAASKLNYVPNHLARSLQGGATRVLGVMLSDMHPFYSAMMEEFNVLADAKGCTLSVKFYGWDEDREQQYMVQFCENRVDGLLWVPSNRSSKAFGQMVRQMEAAMIPLVAIGLTDRETTAAGIHEVGDATADSLRIGLRYLLDKGHRRIAVATATQVHGQRGEMHRNRLRILLDIMKELGIALKPEDLYETEDNDYGGVLLAGEFTKRPKSKRPTAIFAADDMLARAMVSGFYCLGLKIPAEVSVLGYDDAPGDVDTPVPITSVSLGTREIAQKAMKLLMKLTRAKVPPKAYERITVEAKIVERQSVGAPTF